jgi:hypothetical protein
MALASRKSGTIHSKTGSAKAALKARYDAGDHASLENYPAEAALLYQIQLLKEDIDELRRYITAEIGDGAQGSPGARGANGAAGADGADGSDGTTPDITSLDGGNLPTATRRLASGKLWNDRGTVKVV